MPTKRVNIDLDGNDDQVEEQEIEQKDDTADRLAASEKARQEAEIARARAEGEADALKREIKNEPAPVQAALSEDQWQELETKHGKTRQQILADAQLSRATAEEVARPLREMLAEAKRESAEAKDEARRAKSSTSLYAVEKEFFDKNPGLAGHRGDIDSFLADYSEEIRSDPKKFGDLLSKAKTFVRGKVREDRMKDGGRDRTDGSRRINTDRPEFNDDPDTNSDQSKLDLGDLDNEGSRRLIENIARRPGGDDVGDAPPAIDEVSIDKAYKMSERTDGRGVSIDERGEFARGRRRSENAKVVRTTEEERDRRSRR